MGEAGPSTSAAGSRHPRHPTTPPPSSRAKKREWDFTEDQIRFELDRLEYIADEDSDIFFEESSENESVIYQQSDDTDDVTVGGSDRPRPNPVGQQMAMEFSDDEDDNVIPENERILYM